MTSNELTVARAVFTGALLTRDAAAPLLRREDAISFTGALLRTLNRCTSRDVKVCKSFVIRCILPSVSRTAAFTKYALVLAKACASETSDPRASRDIAQDASEGLDERSQQPPNAMFRRLHLLYVVHDILAFLVLRLQKDPAHARTHSISTSAVEQLQKIVPTLAQLAVCNDDKPSAAAKQAREAVEDLVASWEKHDILPASITKSLHESIRSASTMEYSALLSLLADEEAQAALASQRAREEAMKWVIPEFHQLPHDPGAAWHDLPAANGLYQKRTLGYPLISSKLPQGGYRLRNGGREANAETQAEVESLLNEAKRCFDRYTDPAEVEDIDALGNIVWKEGVGRKRRNCWGWSYDGIEQRRKLFAAAQPR